MGEQDWSNIEREHHAMPDWVQEALEERGLMEAYRARPPYQQNDYIGWIRRAKREATQGKRAAQMLDELAQGDVYMKMDWPPGRKTE